MGRYGSRFTHQGSIRGAASYPHRAADRARPRAGNCGPWMARWWQDACSRAKAEPPLDGRRREWDENPNSPSTTRIIQSPIRVGHHTRGPGPGRQRPRTRHRTLGHYHRAGRADGGRIQGIPGAQLPNPAPGGPPWRLTSPTCSRSYPIHTPQSWKRRQGLAFRHSQRVQEEGPRTRSQHWNTRDPSRVARC